MSREIDRRDFSVNKATAPREAELRSLASGLTVNLAGGHRLHIASVDSTTGNPSRVVSVSAPAVAGNYLQRATDHVRGISQVLGLNPIQPAEFVADPHLQKTSSGAVAVHFQQQYKSIPIFQATQAVRFAPDGALTDTAGRSITIDQEIVFASKLSVQAAVLKAAEFVAEPRADEQGATDQFGEPLNLKSVALAGFHPTVIAAFADKADSPTVLEKGPFGDKIKASLVWFPLNDDLRPAWEVIVTMPNYESQFRVIVDAVSGEILYCHQLIQSVAARGNVFRTDGGGGRQMTAFPRPLGDYGLPIPGDLPAGFPNDWVASDSTIGNASNSHQGVSGAALKGAVQSGVLTFNPDNAAGVDQEVLNIFYYNGYMHDYFYLLGFREADGNFQQDNFGRGGAQSDRVDARAHPGAVTGTANMAAPIDGSAPVMNMGLVTATNRHTALDSSVVFHEFTHGVTNRLVGGPLNAKALEAPQSSGMGEGWSDYVACTINSSVVVGAWVKNNPKGIRAFPYDSNYPDHFGKLGTGRYNEEHNIGEIWCATLMETSRNIGSVLCMQLVVDALKLSPANPGFLDMRNAILLALANKRAAGQLNAAAHLAALRGIRTAFAKFGMGPGARSNGAQLNGIVADFSQHIVWHNSATNETQFWFMNGRQVASRGTVLGENGSAAFVGLPWSIVGTGDFNQDGTIDILWHNSATNETQIWLMDGNRIAGRATVIAENGSPIFVGPPWSIVGTGDFNRDGSADILWHNRATNESQIWLMNGNRIAGRATVLAENGSAILVGLPWSIVGAGDFNREGTADILWHNRATNEIQIWFMNGNRIASRSAVLGEDGNPAIVGLPWSIVGTRDFNLDGAADILWHNSATNETQIWFMNGARVARRGTVLGEDGNPAFVGLPWSIAIAGDIREDASPDILWHNSVSNETQLWFMNGERIIGRATVIAENGSPIFVGPPWSIVASGDYNGDGTADILWHNRASNETQIWLMGGHRIAGRATVLGENGAPVLIGPPWSIVGSGDFNRDGIDDILWHNSATNETQIWFMNGPRVAGRATVLGENGSAVFVGPPWSIVGVGDFNRDGNADILWHNSATNETQIWLMNGPRVAGRATVVGENGSAIFVGLPWSIVGSRDFNLDGAADILWHNSATNETQIWFMNSHRIAGRATVLAENGTPAIVGSPWTIVATGDVLVQ